MPDQPPPMPTAAPAPSFRRDSNSISRRSKNLFNLRDTIKYVNKIRARFASDSSKYQKLLEILQPYKRDENSFQRIYKQATWFFDGHLDLLGEFERLWLPRSGSNAGTKGRMVYDRFKSTKPPSKRVRTPPQTVPSEAKPASALGSYEEVLQPYSSVSQPGQPPRGQEEEILPTCRIVPSQPIPSDSENGGDFILPTNQIVPSQPRTASAPSSKPLEALVPRTGPPTPRLAPTPKQGVEHQVDLIGCLDGGEVVRMLNLAPLGSGTFGLVVEGSHSKYGRVALKRPRFMLDGDSDSQLQAFRNEADIWRRLDHPNILQFIGIIERPHYQDIWLVSELAASGPLPAYIRQNPKSDRLSILEQLAGGLRYLHEKGTVHGDVKAGNVLVSGDGQIKLADFGLAKLADTTTTPSLHGAGSLRWQAPELLEAGGGRTYKSDVYAFGLTVFEILNGDVPFSEYKHPMAIILAVMIGERPPTEPMSRDGQDFAPIWEAAKQCWAEDPQQRPAMIDVEYDIMYS